jgi:hypothetical protein
LAVLAVVAAARPAAANFYCQSKVIDVGIRVDEVLRYCGQPAYIDRQYVERSARIGTSPLTTNMSIGEKIITEIQRWTYPGSSSNLARYLTVEDGRVTEIRTGGY